MPSSPAASTVRSRTNDPGAITKMGPAQAQALLRMSVGAPMPTSA